MARADDPYYPLAEEIAAAENAPIAQNLSDAIACHPLFLIWVVSPDFLSDPVMVEFGLAMKDQSSAISSGIITASTLEGARGLWERRSQVQGQNFFAVNAANTAAHIDEGQIIAFASEQTRISPLTKERLKDVLQTADYLTFTGHGGSKYLRLNDEVKITSGDVPPLKPIVIGTGSCQTLRPWKEDSIARGFIDQGAAAYSGFVFSPNEGYLIGEFDGLPFRYTWPDFPIGHVIQVQNRGTLQGFALFPYQHLIGNPQIALQTEAPYHLVDDSQQGDWRILTFRDAPSGVIPIRIPDGAAWHFVEVPGITSAADEDPFYNSRLQMANMGDDKFILLVHKGGDLTLRMRRQAPWYWFPGDVLLDSLDDTFIFMQQTGGDILAMVFAVIPLLWTGWQAFKKRLDRQKILPALLFGIGAAVLQGIYVLARLDHVTITSKTVLFSPLSILAAFILGTCGALIYFHARSWVGKAVALLVTTFLSWSGMVFVLVVLGAFNIFAFMPALGTSLYNYSISLLSAISFSVTLALSSLVLQFITNKKILRV